jgi:hypothetical protein
MPRKHRILVPYPPEVIAAIDQIVRDSEWKRTTFLVELAKREVKRQRLMRILENPEPIWKPEDHPEIDDDGDWVRKLRAESEKRLSDRDQPERSPLPTPTIVL